MSELYLIDSEFKMVETEYASEADLVEEQVSKYVSIINCIVDEKILEGEAGKALLEFAETAKSYMDGKFSEIIQKHKGKTASFLVGSENDDDATFE